MGLAATPRDYLVRLAQILRAGGWAGETRRAVEGGRFRQADHQQLVNVAKRAAEATVVTCTGDFPV